MSRRDRLGKGLGALIAEYVTEEAPDPASVRMVRVGDIQPNPYQPRREFKDEELAELMASIKENGLLQPIVVRPGPAESGAEWQLVVGERRWRAITRLGWQEVPAVVREVDDRTLLVLALVENLQRSQLSALDEAEAYRQLQDEFSLSQAQIAEAVGRERSTVANTLRLLQLPASVRALVDGGSLTAGHARALLPLDDERLIADAARRAVEGGWSVRETEAYAARTRKPARGGKENARTRRDAAERRLEEELQRLYGTAVRIRSSGRNKGRIEIPFYTAEDFERIFEELAGVPVSDLVS
ncbi:MAG TPA: ParB/RepB/Spo0J family partition protein [Longimicrobiales bacterium]|nr:ParB/RepB/Spo0J family partition protein [Longimicrobiales bacterium]